MFATALLGPLVGVGSGVIRDVMEWIKSARDFKRSIKQQNLNHKHELEKAKLGLLVAAETTKQAEENTRQAKEVTAQSHEITEQTAVVNEAKIDIAKFESDAKRWSEISKNIIILPHDYALYRISNFITAQARFLITCLLGLAILLLSGTLCFINSVEIRQEFLAIIESLVISTEAVMSYWFYGRISSSNQRNKSNNDHQVVSNEKKNWKILKRS